MELFFPKVKGHFLRKAMKQELGGFCFCGGCQPVEQWAHRGGRGPLLNCDRVVLGLRFHRDGVLETVSSRGFGSEFFRESKKASGVNELLKFRGLFGRKRVGIDCRAQSQTSKTSCALKRNFHDVPSDLKVLFSSSL